MKEAKEKARVEANGNFEAGLSLEHRQAMLQKMIQGNRAQKDKKQTGVEHLRRAMHQRTEYARARTASTRHSSSEEEEEVSAPIILTNYPHFSPRNALPCHFP
jgi:hypothetical protein